MLILVPALWILILLAAAVPGLLAFRRFRKTRCPFPLGPRIALTPVGEVTMMMPILFAWIGVTVVLIGLMLYRSRVTLNEEDQIFIDAAEAHLAEEQRQIVAKAERISKPIHAFGWLSGGLAVLLIVLVVQDALKRF